MEKSLWRKQDTSIVKKKLSYKVLLTILSRVVGANVPSVVVIGTHSPYNT